MYILAKKGAGMTGHTAKSVPSYAHLSYIVTEIKIYRKFADYFHILGIANTGTPIVPRLISYNSPVQKPSGRPGYQGVEVDWEWFG